jgi:hypothetical protein
MTTHTIGTREEWFAAATLSAADSLCFAAAPSFAIMALLTGVLGGGPRDMLCSATHVASPLSGMGWMYMLMSAFHSTPWLKLISSRRKRHLRGPSCAWRRYVAAVHGTTVRPRRSTAGMRSEG